MKISIDLYIGPLGKTLIKKHTQDVRANIDLEGKKFHYNLNQCSSYNSTCIVSVLFGFI